MPEGQSDTEEYFSDFALKLPRLMQASGVESELTSIDPVVAAEILALVGAVAHMSQRKFAPIATFATGVAVGQVNAAGLLVSDDALAEFVALVRNDLRDGDPGSH
jgi:uncharacterized protein DUF6457